MIEAKPWLIQTIQIISNWNMNMNVKGFLGATAILIAGASLCCISQATTYAYVSNADSQDISVFSLDKSNGSLAPVETVSVGATVMPMSFSPDHLRLYAGLRSKPYRVVSFAVNPLDGRLIELGRAPLADSMAYISTDANGRYLFSASYGGNLLAVNQIGADGVVGNVQQTVKTGPMARTGDSCLHQSAHRARSRRTRSTLPLAS
ncbi:6-phosphogluconolactonase (cycloisomerase 2 family) [Paraburkholderia sp. WC7.3d]